MKKFKVHVLFCLVIIAALVSIDMFIFPMIEENCECVVPEEIVQIMCAADCPGDDCVTWHPIFGRCEGSNCRTSYTIRCLESKKEERYTWDEPCWDCTNW